MKRNLTSRLMSLALATLVGSGCREHNEGSRTPLAVSHKTPQGIRSYVDVSSGRYLVKDLGDRYEIEKVEGAIPSSVQTMTDLGKDGSLEHPAYPINVAHEHRELYEEIFAAISAAEKD